MTQFSGTCLHHKDLGGTEINIMDHSHRLRVQVSYMLEQLGHSGMESDR